MRKWSKKNLIGFFKVPAVAGVLHLLIGVGLIVLVSLPNHSPAPPSQPPRPTTGKTLAALTYALPANFVPDYSLPPAQNGLVPVVWRVSTTEPVVFLTIDDGVFTPVDAADYIKEQRLEASLFLYYAAIKNHPDYFRELASNHSVVENHTFNHPKLNKLPYDQQKSEICAGADQIAELFGQRPTLLRPPYGFYNEDTLRAANDCGMRAVVMWDVVIQNGALNYLKEINALRPGDIVLLHFRPNLVDDLKAFTAAANQMGLSVDLLENWLK